MKFFNDRFSPKDYFTLVLSMCALTVSIWGQFNSRVTQRAYMLVEPSLGNSPKLLLKTIGTGFSKDVTVYISTITVPDDAPDVPTPDQWKASLQATLGPFMENATLLSGSQYPLPVGRPYNLGKDKVIDITFGTVQYRDVFGTLHTTHFCFRAQDFPCRKGNDAD